MNQNKIELLMAVLIILIAILFSTIGVEIVEGKKVKNVKATIVIDSGHGGIDSGKVSVYGDYEKDINLSIAKLLKQKLEKEGYNVIMTRTKDEGLYNIDSNNKKHEDLKNRCSIIDGSNAKLAISIHQNSYTSSDVFGAQVFYYEYSKEGKQLALSVQEALKSGLDNSNRREAKSNNQYYLLKKTTTPTIIVECGFLSNYEEAKSLTTKKYQQKIVNAIFEGIENYL